MTEIKFVKGHGTENDFVLVYDPERDLDLTPELVSALCDRRAGIGADGVLRVVLASADPEGQQMSDQARWFMDYRNADGSIAEMCGNGMRVFARYLVDRHLDGPGEIQIATRAGVRTATLSMMGDVTVDLGPYGLPELGPVEVQVGERTWPAHAVTMPNPHAVVFVDELAHAGELRVAPTVRPALVYPDGVNVEFVERVGPRHVRMRVHERGVGETRSCGTGAAAVAVALALEAGELSADAPPSGPISYQIDPPGGELTATVHPDRSVDLTGPAMLVGAGVIEDAWLRAAAARPGD